MARTKIYQKTKRMCLAFGSVWTWTALDADSKLICSWMVGNRDAVAAREFIQDLAGRLANRIQHNRRAQSVSGGHRRSVWNGY